VREADAHHLHVPNVMKIWEPKTSGTLWATPGQLRDSFNFFTCFEMWYWRRIQKIIWNDRVKMKTYYVESRRRGISYIQ
jgi:hypothetical protein